MFKEAAIIGVIGAAVWFSGVLSGDEGDAATPTMVTARSAEADAGAAAASSGPTPEICGRLLTEFANGQRGGPEGRATNAPDAAYNETRSAVFERRFEAAGCTSDYMNEHSDEVLAVVNRSRPPSQHVR